MFPKELGRVFRSLTERVEGLSHGKNPPSHAIIVGYRESELVVREHLIRPRESKLSVVRVRPGIEKGKGNVSSGAREFFEALRIEIELQKKQAGRG